MKPGDRVKVRYVDAHRLSVVWDGVLKEQVNEGWRVEVGDVVMLFPTDRIEVIDEKAKANEGPVTGQE